MLTRRQFQMPILPTLKSVNLSGNTVQDVQTLKDDVKALLDALSNTQRTMADIMRWFDVPGAVVVGQGLIDNTPIGGTTASTGAFTSLTFSADLTASGSGKRCLADFSNATRANRFLFKDATTNNGSNVGVIPNGTSNTAALTAYGGSDPDNTHAMLITTSATQTMLNSTKFGTGTQRALELQIGGVTKAKIDPNGNNVLGVSAALATTATDGFTYIPSCAGAPTGTPTAFTGMVPLIYDTTNNKLYAYNAAWKSVTLA